MKLTFKDLKQQKFTIEAESSDTILALKEKISGEKGWEVSQQKLIYSGKILQDQNTVESYNIEEKGFIVCMISKPKAQPTQTDASSSSNPTTKAAPTTPAPPQPAPSSTSALPESRTADAPHPTPPTAVAAPSGPASFNDPSALTMGSQREAAIQNVMEMGYGREEVDRAMRAAFYNPDRAVEYLLTGIPEHLEGRRQPPQPPADEATPANPTSPPPPVSTSNEENINLFEAAANAARQRQQGGPGGPGADLGNLEFLRSNPQFQQLRQVVQQQPHLLEPILQQVSHGNPGLAALINQHQDQFLQLLGEPNDEDDGPGLPEAAGTHQIVVTEEERVAIERLCSLGFERDLVIQVYFACDKNEALAANCLFEQQEENDG